MPLRVKCGNCGRELLLEDVFGGACCRCRHCRHIVQVPAASSPAASRSAVRPDRPPSTGVKTPLARVSTPQAVPRRLAAAKLASRSLYSQFFGVGLVCIAATALSVSTWQVSGTRSPRLLSPPRVPISADDHGYQGESVQLATNAPHAFALADPLKTVGGVELRNGDVVAYVVDGDVAMAPFIGPVALIINRVNEAIEPGTIRFGVVMATGGEGQTILEVAEPTCDLAGARSVLTARLPGGQTDLAKALAKTIDWDATKVFLLLAKRLDTEQLALLKQNAEQTGAAVNVFAMGEAAKQPELERIAMDTGGSYLPLSARMVNDWVERVEKAVEAAQTAQAAQGGN